VTDEAPIRIDITAYECPSCGNIFIAEPENGYIKCPNCNNIIPEYPHNAREKTYIPEKNPRDSNVKEKTQTPSDGVCKKNIPLMETLLLLLEKKCLEDNLLPTISVTREFSEELKQAASLFIPVWYVWKTKVVTHKSIQQSLGVSEMTALRYLSKLEWLGYITKAGEVRHGKRGPRLTLYASFNATEEDISGYRQRLESEASPEVAEAQRITQLVIDGYMEPRGLRRIRQLDMVRYLYGRGVQLNQSLLDMVLQHLYEKGYEVVR